MKSLRYVTLALALAAAAGCDDDDEGGPAAVNQDAGGGDGGGATDTATAVPDGGAPDGGGDGGATDVAPASPDGPPAAVKLTVWMHDVVYKYTVEPDTVADKNIEDTMDPNAFDEYLK